MRPDRGLLSWPRASPQPGHPAARNVTPPVAHRADGHAENRVDLAGAPPRERQRDRPRSIRFAAMIRAAALSVPALLGAHPAQADEPADLRVNQELLQRRLDQLAQARIPGNPYGVGTPAGPVNVQMTGGSFPRSFLIPGTDTSIRVGGEIRMNTSLLDCRRQPEPEPAKHQRRHHGTAEQYSASGPSTGSAGLIARERSDNILNMQPTQSKLSVETRTPTAWGEARSFLEFDFAGEGRQREPRVVYRQQPASPVCAMPMALSARSCSARQIPTSTMPTPGSKPSISAV